MACCAGALGSDERESPAFASFIYTITQQITYCPTKSK